MIIKMKKLCRNFIIMLISYDYLKFRIGINLEMIFRAADVQRKGLILLDEFRLFLKKLKLNLSDKEINIIL